MNNEYDVLPSINNNGFAEKSSINNLNNQANDYLNNNNSSDCDSILSEKNDRNKEKKSFYDNVFKAKYDSKSIVNVAKDLKKNIQVKVIVGLNFDLLIP